MNNNYNTSDVYNNYGNNNKKCWSKNKKKKKKSNFTLRAIEKCCLRVHSQR